MPIEVKKATLRVACIEVSSWMVMDCCRSRRTSVVKSRPPITAAGMLSRSSQRMRFRSWMPMK